MVENEDVKGSWPWKGRLVLMLSVHCLQRCIWIHLMRWCIQEELYAAFPVVYLLQTTCTNRLVDKYEMHLLYVVRKKTHTSKRQPQKSSLCVPYLNIPGEFAFLQQLSLQQERGRNGHNTLAMNRSRNRADQFSALWKQIEAINIGFGCELVSTCCLTPDPGYQMWRVFIQMFEPRYSFVETRHIWFSHHIRSFHEAVWK